jgi:hypothetical protein
MVSEWFGLKTTRTVFAGLASKPVAMVFSSLASKLVVMVSPGLASKPAVGFFVEPQNQGGGEFSGLGLKTGSSGLVIWASKSPRWFFGFGPQNQVAFRFVSCATKPMEGGRRGSGLLRVEASLARVSQSGLKTGGGATTSGAHGTIAEVASEAS